MIRSQKLLLSPTNDQLVLIRRAAGLSRFCWNWAKPIRERHHKIYGKSKDYRRAGEYRIRNHWNKRKRIDKRLTWANRLSKFIHANTFKELDDAYKAAFGRIKKGGIAGFPRFHKKGIHESFCVLDSGSNKLPRRNHCYLFPRIGYVKCVTPMRWPNAKPVYARVKLEAGRWWLTVSYELKNPRKLSSRRPSCGVDLGCRKLATIVSKGKLIESVVPLKPFAKTKRRLKRLQRSLAKKQKGSKRREKAKLRVAKCHQRIANQRNDCLHKLSSRLVKKYGTIVLEDLNVKGMMTTNLAGTIADLGFAEFRRQVEYKAEVTGTKVVFADRFFPSSKLCSACGEKHPTLGRGDYEFACPTCGYTVDRDVNAAKNLEKLGHGMSEVKHSEKDC